MRGARKTGRVLLGGALWLLLLGGAAWLSRTRASELRQPAGELARFLTVAPTRLEVELTAGPAAAGSAALAVGDPVLDRERRVLGRVEALTLNGGQVGAVASGTRCLARLVIDPEVHLAADARFRARTAPRDSAAWVMETLLPAHKRDMLTAELTAFARANEAELLAFIRPLAEDVVQHGMQVLEQNLAPTLQKHEDEIRLLLDEQREQLKGDLLPALKKRLGPSARRKLDPIVREIGGELRQKLPMWTIGYNAALDWIPGTSKDRLEKWWAQFVDETVVPIIAAHEGELVKACEQLIEEGLADPEVRQAFARASRRLAADPRFKTIVRTIVEEALVRPFDGRALLEKMLADPRHKERLERLQRAFAPTLRRIGHRLTIDPETGRIDPDLARVLRRVVFDKDARWVELE